MRLDFVRLEFLTLGLDLICIYGVIGKEDNNKNCVAWAAKGECKKNPKYMMRICPKSCEEDFIIDAKPAQQTDSLVEDAEFIAAQEKVHNESESSELKEEQEARQTTGIFERLQTEEATEDIGSKTDEKASSRLEKQFEEAEGGLHLLKTACIGTLSKLASQEVELMAGKNAIKKVSLLEQQLNETQSDFTATQHKLQTRAEASEQKLASQEVELRNALEKVSLLEKQLKETEENLQLQKTACVGTLSNFVKLASQEIEVNAGKEVLEKVSLLQKQVGESQSDLTRTQEKLRMQAQSSEQRLGSREDLLPEQQLSETQISLASSQDKPQMESESLGKESLGKDPVDQEVELQDALEKISLLEKQLADTQKDLTAAQDKLLVRRAKWKQTDPSAMASDEGEADVGREGELKAQKEAWEKVSLLEQQVQETQSELTAAQQKLQAQTEFSEQKIATQEIELKDALEKFSALEKQLLDTQEDLTAAQQKLQGQTDSSEAVVDSGEKDALEKVSLLDKELNETQSDAAQGMETKLNDALRKNLALGKELRETQFLLEGARRQCSSQAVEVTPESDNLGKASLLEKQLNETQKELTAAQRQLQRLSSAGLDGKNASEKAVAAAPEKPQKQADCSELRKKLASKEVALEKARIRGIQLNEQLTKKENELKVALAKV